MKKLLLIFLMVSVIVAVGCSQVKEAIPNDMSIVIDVADNTCSLDDDCTRVSTKCNGCECEGEPVNKIYQEKYQQMFDEKCGGYEGPVCDVMCALSELKCVDNICTVIMI